MSASIEPVEILEGGEDIFEKHRNDLMEMFNVATFREKWSHVREGLKQPSGSGANKWAKLQVLRLLAPVAAVVVPILVLAILLLIPKPVDTDIIPDVAIIEPKPIEILDEKKEIVVKKEKDIAPIVVDIVVPDIIQPPVDDLMPPKDITLKRAEVTSVAITKCPTIMKNIIGCRTPGTRATQLARFDAIETDKVVLRALRYLKKSQNSDGSWGKNRVAMTSLALLSYLAHGEKPNSKEFGSTVQAAIEYIQNAQQADGHFVGRDGHDYTQPIAAYAMAEAYSMIKRPDIKDVAVKAIIPIIKGQNPSGGFNYNLKPSQRDDTSYMAWCVQAIKAAKMAKLYDDIPSLKECMTKSISGFRKNYGERDGYGGFGYTGKGHGRSGLTGAGVLSLQFLGASKVDECRSGLNGLSKWEFNWDRPMAGSFLYYMYYTTQAKFQEGGNSWDRWDDQFKPGLIDNQDVTGKNESGYFDHNGVARAIGSWKSPAKREHNGGDDIMDTIMCTLMLEVYIRYLPTFMIVPDDEAIEEIGGDIFDVPVDIVDRGSSRKNV